jgi:hypothetical protein
VPIITVEYPISNLIKHGFWPTSFYRINVNGGAFGSLHLGLFSDGHPMQRTVCHCVQVCT